MFVMFEIDLYGCQNYCSIILLFLEYQIFIWEAETYIMYQPMVFFYLEQLKHFSS